MKTLWISNIIFPSLCHKIGIPAPFGGGWMESAATQLLQAQSSIRLGVVSFWGKDKFLIEENNGVKHYLVPEKGNKWHCYDKRIENFMRQIRNDFRPDIIHIHGSEYGHSLAWVRACGPERVIVSIQGLVHFYANYYFGGISNAIIRKNVTPRDIIRLDSLFQQQKGMAKRGLLEVELLQKVNHVIGRTSWDKSCVWSINPNICYHACNETLRPSFYQAKWDYDICHKHTIFLSQSHYPIKGIQQVIKALPLVLRHFPDTKVLVAGKKITQKSKFRENGFSKYISSLIKRHGVEGHIVPLGPLDETQMVEQYLRANVFVCPSAIENSPNSVGEAQLVGTPVVASYVGGTMDMVHDGATGFLYRFEEVPLLAMRICQLFDDVGLCHKISAEERQEAALRHNKETNAKRLLQIYGEILTT